MRLIDRKLTDIINGLVQTFPQEKMISLRRMIPGMAYKAYYAKPAAVEKDETIMEQSQVDVLCDYAHEQCKMCIDMKCSACPLGKVFDSILSDDRDGRSGRKWTSCGRKTDNKSANVCAFETGRTRWKTDRAAKSRA